MIDTVRVRVSSIRDNGRVSETKLPEDRSRRYLSSLGVHYDNYKEISFCTTCNIFTVLHFYSGIGSRYADSILLNVTNMCLILGQVLCVEAP